MIILIVDTREIIRSGLKKALSSNHIFYEASHTTEIQSIIKSQSIDLIIINQTLITDSCQLPPDHFLIIASRVDLRMLEFAYSHRALGYILESCPEELLRGLTSLSSGQFFLDPTLTFETLGMYLKSVPSITRIDTLTPREQEIFAFLRIGLSNKTIASKLQISETTVKTHIARIYKKMGLGGRIIKFVE